MKNKKVLSLITSICLLVFLVIVCLYASVWSVDKKHKVNSRISTLKLNVYHESMGHYMEENIYGNNSEMLILYFFNEFNEEELNEVLSVSDNVKTYVISTYDNYETNLKNAKEKCNKDNVLFAYDDSNASALTSFTDEAVYPYYLWSDKNSTLKYESNESIKSQSDQIAITLSGGTIGNNVGDYCYTRDIKTLKISDNTLVDDTVFNVSNNKGKITVINFWGYWCTPCKQELPHFNQIQEEYKDDVTIIAIHQGSAYLNEDDKMHAYDYIESNSDYSILWGYDDASDTYYSMLGGTSTYPISIIVDQNGYVSFTRIGSLSYDELKNEITKLLQ